MREFVCCAGYALMISFVALPATAATNAPDTRAQRACDTGWIWSETLKKCVRLPRGSYDGN